MTRPGHLTKDHDPTVSVREKIKGVFSTQSVVKVGTGTTTRRTIQKTYWSVQELASGDIEIQPLNKNYVPSGPKRTVSKEDFLAKFSPEPEFYVSTVLPKMQELETTIVRGEKHRERGENYSAEFEFKNATKVDEENVRANFGLGLTYLDRGEKTKANDIFERLVKLDAVFDTQHKHLFNDFGINLRKNGMIDQALDYYLRAADLADRDDHLFHNIARAYYEKGDVKKCVEYLKKSLDLAPELEEGKLFWAFLEQKGYIKGGEVAQAAGEAASREAQRRQDKAERRRNQGKKETGEAKPIKLNL
jgi:tetratricopeptide (TPR) repeat protein